MDWDSVRWHPVNIGTRGRDNRYPGCTCPDWRYCPSRQHERPTNPSCPTHGDVS